MTVNTTALTRGALVTLAAAVLLGGYASAASPGLAAGADAGGASTGPCRAPNAPAPVFEAVTFKTQEVPYEIVRPEFHFRDVSGTVRYIHRELVATDDPGLTRINSDSIIRIPAPVQRAGAVFLGGWPCGSGQYYVTIRAFLIDLDGGRSDTLQYTIHCNGG